MKKTNKPKVQSGELVPQAMRIQLARLFGSGSRKAEEETRTPAQWRRTLRAVLRELNRYVASNVDTDELHRLMLMSGLAAADESLKREDFWPGYVEGITRLALLLLGDYPDHRKLRPGRKKGNHYNLSGCRSGQWVQTPEQRFRTLWAAGRVGYPKFSVSPGDVLDNFRRQYGHGPGHSEFMEWYREHFPSDYALLFR